MKLRNVILTTVLFLSKKKGEKIMRKLSKLLVMAVVVLAVITMSMNVNASTQALKDYVGDIHNINGMTFELTNNQKTAVLNYISGLSDATAASIQAKISQAENLIRESGATSLSQISLDTKEAVLSLAKSAAQEAGLNLSVDTKGKTFTLTKSDGSVLTSGGYTSLMGNVGSASTAGGSATGTASGSTLLYTGANYAVYAVAVLAIVAVAIVVKKRA